MTDLNKDSGHEGPEETAEETVQASQAAGGTAGKQDKRNGRFSMGVLAGALGAVIIICGAAGLWKASHRYVYRRLYFGDGIGS